MATEITLAAAIRDSASDDEHFRTVAVRNLASAYLEAVGRPGPVWRGETLDPRGPQVVAALWHVFRRDPALALRGLAAVGLGTLGQTEIQSAVDPWLAEDGKEDAAVYRRECAVIALSLVGAAAPREEHEIREDIAETLTHALRSLHPDMRFQAGVALADVSGSAAEPTLLDALAAEQDHRVRANLVHALASLGPPSPSVIAAWVRELDGGAELEAALALAGARRAEGGARLVAALSDPGARDDALEALAALGPRAPSGVRAEVQRLTRGWRVPGVTKVRAAYALARISPDEGLARLDRLARHPRRVVREAVQEAKANLRKFEASPAGSGGHETSG